MAASRTCLNATPPLWSTLKRPLSKVLLFQAVRSFTKSTAALKSDSADRFTKPKQQSYGQGNNTNYYRPLRPNDPVGVKLQKESGIADINGTSLRFDRFQPSSERYKASELSPQAVALEQRLAANHMSPRAVLHESIMRQDATKETLALCLRKAFVSVKALPRKRRLAAIREMRIGGMSLGYVWDRQDIWAEIIDTDLETQFTLCYFAVGEGHLNLLSAWLSIETPPALVFRMRDGRRLDNSWRGMLLRGVIEAQDMLDIDHSLDRMLAFFFSVVKSKDDARIQPKGSYTAWSADSETINIPIGATNLWPATIAIENAIRRNLSPNTAVDLFDRYIAFRERFKAKESEQGHEYSMSSLLLNHPRHPDVTRAARYLENLSRDQQRLHATASLSPQEPGFKVFQGYFERVYQVACETGREEVAGWLDEARHRDFAFLNLSQPDGNRNHARRHNGARKSKLTFSAV